MSWLRFFRRSRADAELQQEIDAYLAEEEVLGVEQGSLYPALHRLEDRGWVSSFWGASENNRKAKFYRLTVAGRKQLVRERSRWRQMIRAIGLVMGEEATADGGTR